MATAHIEGPLTGHWGTDQATLHRWESWGGGYRYARLMSPSSGTAHLVLRGDTAPPPDPADVDPIPAAVPHPLVAPDAPAGAARRAWREVERAIALTVLLPIPDGQRLALGEDPGWPWEIAARTAWAAAATRAGLAWRAVRDDPAYPGLQAALVEVAGQRLALQVGRVDQGSGYAVRATTNGVR